MCSVCVAQVLDALATAIDREIGSLMHDIDHVQIGLHIFDFLGNAVLAEVDTQLATAMPGAQARHCGICSLLWPIRRKLVQRLRPSVDESACLYHFLVTTCATTAATVCRSVFGGSS